MVPVIYLAKIIFSQQSKRSGAKSLAAAEDGLYFGRVSNLQLNDFNKSLTFVLSGGTPVL